MLPLSELFFHFFRFCPTIAAWLPRPGRRRFSGGRRGAVTSAFLPFLGLGINIMLRWKSLMKYSLK